MTTEQTSLEPTVRLEPTELDIHLSYLSGSEHHITVERSSDLHLCLRALGREGGCDETGTVLIRLGIDGDSGDEVLIDTGYASRGHDMLEVVGQAREALEAVTTALVRLRRS